MFLRFIFPCSKSSTPTEGRMARSGEAAERPCVRILEASTDLAFLHFTREYIRSIYSTYVFLRSTL